MLSLLATLPLLLPPTTLAPTDDAADPASASASAPAPAVEELDHEARVAALKQADDAMNLDPVGSIGQVEAALAELEARPDELAADEDALELRTYARLNLARAYQIAGQEERAVEVMDEAIRIARADELPAKAFGPDLEELYEERKQAFAARDRGTLEIRCIGDCRVYVDERGLELGSNELPLGTYRVWIEADDGSREPLVQTVELSEADAEVALEYRAIKVEVPPPPPPPPPKRIVPRGGAVVMLLAGGATTVIGAAVLHRGIQDSVAGQGTGGTGVIGAGIAVLGIGGALLTSGVVILSVDEVRVRRATGQQATLSWTTRF